MYIRRNYIILYALIFISVACNGQVLKSQGDRYYAEGGNVIIFNPDIIDTTVYYVSNSGSDINIGSINSPLAHHPWASDFTGSVSLIPGDNVYMNKGDTWSVSSASESYLTVGQNGALGNHITTTSYGTGAKPIIKITTDDNYPVINGDSASYITFDNLDIQHYSLANDGSESQSGIRFGELGGIVPHDWVITNCDIYNIPHIGIDGDDDAYNIVVGDTTAIERATTTTYSNHIYDCNYAGVQLLGTNEGATLSNFDVWYNYINNIDSLENEVNDYGIAFTAATDSRGWPIQAVAKYNYVSNVRSWHGIDTHGGEDIYIDNNYVRDCRMGIVAISADRVSHPIAILDNISINYNRIENSGAHPSSYYQPIVVNGEDDLLRPVNIYIQYDTILYTVREAETSGFGIHVYWVDTTLIQGNYIFNGPLTTSNGGIYISEPSFPSKNVTVIDNWVIDWDDGMQIRPSGMDGELLIYNNIIYSHGQCIRGHTGATGGNIKIYHNTLMATQGVSNQFPIDFFTSVTISSGDTLDVKNNIFCLDAVASTGRYFMGPGTITGILQIDYNLYWNCSYGSPYVVLGGVNTWSAWNTAGYDGNGFNNNDPNFVNAGGSYALDTDFQIPVGSDAVDGGIDVSVSTDYAGETRTNPPDIGAYKYIAP